MRIPLHLDPNDNSVEANAKRFDLYCEMAEMNPKGFRQYSAKKGNTKKGSRRGMPTRMEKIARTLED